MFICKSYINKPDAKITNLEKANEEWEKYFIEVFVRPPESLDKYSSLNK